MANTHALVKLDLNNPQFQQSLFALDKQVQSGCLPTLKKISSIPAPAGVDQVYSIRIPRSARALVFREGEFMRFLLVSKEHDGVYGKK